MCIIAHKGIGITLAKEVYEECFNSNKDGAGFAAVHDGQLVVKKGFFTFDEFYNAILPHSDEEMVIHCRIATHGEVHERNCHPFTVVSRHNPQFSFAIAHNGVLQWRSTKELSDTACFVNAVLDPLLDRDPWFLDHEYGRMLIESKIGSFNKLAIMRFDSETKQTTTYLLNESAGTRDLGCWFSNRSYQKRPVFQRFQGLDLENDWNAYGYHEENGKWVPNRLRLEAEESDWPKVKQGSIVGFAKQSVIADLPTVKLEGDIKIEVPRDAEVIFSMNHLTKRERKIIRRMAADYLKYNGIDTKGFSNHEMITWLREDVKDKIAELRETPDQTIDSWLIAKRNEVTTSEEIQKELEHL